MDDNTFSEYRGSALPYQRNDDVPQRPAQRQMREQQAFPQRPIQPQMPVQQPLPQSLAQPQMYEQQALPQRPMAVPQVRSQQRPAPAKMPKVQALTLLRRMKRGIVIASFLSFGAFSTLVMSHTVGTTTTATTATPAQQATPAATTTSKTTTTTPTATTTTPTATATITTQQGGGYGFGSSTSTSNPVSGTHTS